MFFENNLRNVNPYGVNLVMKHFVSGGISEAFATDTTGVHEKGLELICDEESLDP